MKAHELINTREKWTTGTLARDKEEQKVEYDSPQAVCWCMWGAICKLYPFIKKNGEYNYERAQINKKIELATQGLSPGNWNDSSTYEQVFNLLKKLDI